MKDILIHPTTVYEAGVHVLNTLYLEAKKNLKRGDTITIYAGAPGTGRIVYVVTRINHRGVFGRVVSNTMRVMHPSEVR